MWLTIGYSYCICICVCITITLSLWGLMAARSSEHVSYGMYLLSGSKPDWRFLCQQNQSLRWIRLWLLGNYWDLTYPRLEWCVAGLVGPLWLWKSVRKSADIVWQTRLTGSTAAYPLGILSHARGLPRAWTGSQTPPCIAESPNCGCGTSDNFGYDLAPARAVNILLKEPDLLYSSRFVGVLCYADVVQNRNPLSLQGCTGPMTHMMPQFPGLCCRGRSSGRAICWPTVSVRNTTVALD